MLSMLVEGVVCIPCWSCSRVVPPGCLGTAGLGGRADASKRSMIQRLAELSRLQVWRGCGVPFGIKGRMEEWSEQEA